MDHPHNDVNEGKKKADKRRRKKRKKEEKKRKRKKKRRKGGGGSSGGSSSSTSSSGRSSKSKSTRGSEESSDSSLLAPLQRKSRHNPGGVLKMLIKHARQLMDQDSAVDLGEDPGLLGGVRMTSYFSLMLRPYHSASSRDMKEPYLLATTIDQLRQGKLGALGDAMASRFIAIQTAMMEGNWRSAQYLEMHPLDAGSPAPVPLLLESRKHAKLIDKSQRQEDFRGGKGYWRNTDRSSWTYDDPPKGKGKKGKQGKGEGKGRGSWSVVSKEGRQRESREGFECKEGCREGEVGNLAVSPHTAGLTRADDVAGLRSSYEELQWLAEVGSRGSWDWQWPG